MTKPLGIALIGTGYMGKAHAYALNNIQTVFADIVKPKLEILCDVPAEKAAQFATQFGFARASDDWRTVIADPAIDLVCITTPNKLHAEMAIAAAEAGKHIWCEKPLALNLPDAQRMMIAAKTYQVKTMIGYNYTHNPAFLHAKKLIAEGAIGNLVHFRGTVDEDYQADPDTPWSWRCLAAEAGLGTLGDLGCHLVSIAYGLMGPVASLKADMQTIHKTRPKPGSDEYGPVENEDLASALVQFENGLQGSLVRSRSAWGRKNYLSWEVHGDRGMIFFDQERMNELKLYQQQGDVAQQGFKTILTGPAHPPYQNFVPAAGHSLGFMDQKLIEAGAFLREIQGGPQIGPDIAQAYEFEKVIHAIARAAETDQRVHLKDM